MRPCCRDLGVVVGEQQHREQRGGGFRAARGLCNLLLEVQGDLNDLVVDLERQFQGFGKLWWVRQRVWLGQIQVVGVKLGCVGGNG